jgi:hypothetical protein
VAITDSLTLRLEFTQVLPPEPPPSGSVSVVALPDSTPVAVANVWRQAEYDSITAAERGRLGPGADTAVTDTARAAEAAVAAAAADTAARPPAPVRPRPAEIAPGQQADTTRARRAAADTSRAARLLRERPRLSNVLMVRLEQPLAPGGRYLVLTDLPNMIGIRGVGRQVVAVPERAK